ncbi:MAG TPA: hypothetical protein VG124_07950, partial [Beijerinckiaceae bacterium]|nr:hypothetical protein [Beijerinckiaceae bacterium]
DTNTNTASNTTSFTSTLDTIHKPPVVTAGATITYTEGSAPMLADSTLALSDSDTIKSATVAITGGFIAGDTLDFNNGTENFETFADNGTISASFNAASGVLTLTAVGGSASFTDFQTALDRVRFVNPGDPTGGGTDPTRTLTWTVVDTNQTANTTGSSTSTINTVHTPVSVTAGGTGVLVTYTEGQTTTTLLDSGVTLSDSDPIASATVSVSGYQNGDILDFTGNTATETFADGATISASFNAANGVLTLTTTSAATASAADYAQALASVEFRETAGDDPTHGGAGSETARTVTWTVTDTNTNTASNTTSFTSTLDTIHKPPVVTAGVNITYTEGSGPTLADSTLALSDSDTIKSATVAITGGFLAGDTLDFNNGSENFETFADNGTISASFNAASGVLTLTAVGGSASFTDFQTALDHVRFVNTGDPTGGGTDPTRTLTWTVVDTNQTANNTGSSTSTINTTHTPVSVTAGGTGVLVTYTEGQRHAGLDGHCVRGRLSNGVGVDHLRRDAGHRSDAWRRGPGSRRDLEHHRQQHHGEPQRDRHEHARHDALPEPIGRGRRHRDLHRGPNACRSRQRHHAERLEYGDERDGSGERLPGRRYPQRRQSRWAHARERRQRRDRAQWRRLQSAISNRAGFDHLQRGGWRRPDAWRRRCGPQRDLDHQQRHPELEQRHEHARHGSYAEPDGRRDGDLHAKSNVGGPAR